MRNAGKIGLLLADVDGTLVTRDKVLTDRAKDAVRRMRQAGIRFAITSGRPPKGMAMLIEPLGLDTPIAGFNGGLFVRPDLSIIEERTLAPDVVARARIDPNIQCAAEDEVDGPTTGWCEMRRRRTSIARSSRTSTGFPTEP